MSSTQKITMVGTGSYAPAQVVSNLALAESLPTTDHWIQSKLGIKERRVAVAGESTSVIAVKAANKALANAEIEAEDLDLVIVATATPDRLAPSTAAIVQDAIGARNAAAFDLAAVCTGFLYSMTVATQFLTTGMYKTVMVVGADVFSSITDWTRRDAVFFGDGAGAAIFRSGGAGEFLASNLYADGSGKWAFTVPAGGSEMPATRETVDQRLHSFQMDGHAVFDTAVKVLPEAIEAALNQAKVSINDISLMIPHQPSVRILKATAEKIGLPWEKVCTNMDRYANTSGGTIPILLDEVNRQSRIRPGDIILFAAVGSGWTYGASVYRWG